MKKLLNYPICLFLIVPFAYWLGAGFSALYIPLIALFGCLTRLKDVKTKITPVALFAALFSFAYALVAFLRYRGTWGGLFHFGPSDQSFLLLQALQFFLLLFIIDLTGRIDREEYRQYLKYVFIVLISTILVESFLTNIVHLPSSFFPAYKVSPIYSAPVVGNYKRPFGLTGNAPMNGSILVVIMWLYLGVSEKRRRDILGIHLITVFALIVNYSGQAVLSYLITTLLFILRIRPKAIALFILLAVLFHLIYSQGWLGYKMTYAYLVRNLEFLYFSETMSYLSVTDLLLGVLGNIPALDTIHTEFYLTFSLSRFGVLLTAALWGLLFLQIRTNRRIRMGIYAAFIGSLHYASILTIVLQVPLAIFLVNKGLIDAERA